MRPAEGTHLFIVDDQAILLHEPAQKLYHLNTTAACVWCLLEETDEPAVIASRLQEVLSVSPETAADYLKGAEDTLRALGVLRGSELAAAPPPEPEAPVSEAPDEGAFVVEHRYALLSSRIRMRFTSPHQALLAGSVLQHLEDRGAGPPTVTLDIVRDEDGRTRLLRDQVRVFDCEEDSRLVPLVKSLIWQTTVVAHDFFLDIHAAVVGDGTHCYLFPAASGSGKSTLFAALVHAGFEYFSDEVALLHPGDMTVAPVPLALCVKNTGVGILADRYPALEAIAEHLRGDGKRVRYLRPPEGAVPPPTTRRPVGALIFPCYAPGQPTTLTPLGRFEALQCLMRECVIVDTRLDADKVAGLLAWLERTPSHRLAFSDLDDAVAVVRKLTCRSDAPR